MPFQEFKSRLLARKLELERQVAAIERDFAQGRSADFAEGVAAFLAKRPARFSGR